MFIAPSKFLKDHSLSSNSGKGVIGIKINKQKLITINLLPEELIVMMRLIYQILFIHISFQE